MITLLMKHPATFLLIAIPLLYSIILHEIAHGWVAYLFGDDTAKRSGRLSLNPLIHLDPVGTILLFIAGFGWARPVPVDYSKIRSFRIGLICVSLAGCLTNILIAAIAILIIQATAIRSNQFAYTAMLFVANINIMLGALNLIPIPPLDGSRILLAILPEKAQIAMVRFEPYGLLVLFGLLFTGLLNPIIMFVTKVILAFIGLVVKI
jgi:Zn-dependent protease